MTSDRITVSRRLHVAALADAIHWTQSLIDGGDTHPVNLARLAAYRLAYRRATGHAIDITLADLSASDYKNWHDS